MEHFVDDGEIDRQDSKGELVELFVDVVVREHGLQGGQVRVTAE